MPVARLISKKHLQWSFYMYYRVQKFFACFSTDSNSASNFAFSETHIKMLRKNYLLLLLVLFASFIDKRGQNG
jgi:hypothetical protein